MSTTIGLTTTIPVEIPFAAGATPIDLNNVFVGSSNAAAHIDLAERAGFPASLCAWIKGLYGTIHSLNLDAVLGVVEGDCSETHALLDILRSEGTLVIPFAYPHQRSRQRLEEEMQALADELGTTLDAAESMKDEIDSVRRIARRIDEYAWQDGTVTSEELFSSLLRLSDLAGGIQATRHALTETLNTIEARSSAPDPLRLACVGVPPILGDLWPFFEQKGARFVYHETPHQFSRIDGIELDLIESYRSYTYPYDAAHRIKEIARQVEMRNVSGVVHYVQSFCHRQLHDRLLRNTLSVPILTLEADRPGPIDGRTQTRIEAYLEQLGR